MVVGLLTDLLEQESRLADVFLTVRLKAPDISRFLGEIRRPSFRTMSNVHAMRHLGTPILSQLGKFPRATQGSIAILCTPLFCSQNIEKISLFKK